MSVGADIVLDVYVEHSDAEIVVTRDPDVVITVAAGVVLGGNDGPIDWADVEGTPTTLAGYGITDGATDAEVAAFVAHLAAVDPHPQYTTAGEVASALATALAGYQPLDADLTAIAALATTPFGRGLLTLANAAALAAAAGLGPADTPTFAGVTVPAVTGVGGALTLTAAVNVLFPNAGLYQAFGLTRADGYNVFTVMSNGDTSLTGNLSVGGLTLSTLSLGNSWGIDKLIFRADAGQKITTDGSGNFTWVVGSSFDGPKSLTLSQVTDLVVSGQSSTGADRPRFAVGPRVASNTDAARQSGFSLLCYSHAAPSGAAAVSAYHDGSGIRLGLYGAAEVPQQVLPADLSGTVTTDDLRSQINAIAAKLRASTLFG